MTITLFVKPETLPYFLEVTRTLRHLPLENSYRFIPFDLVFSEAMVSDWIWVNMKVREYLKLKYCIEKQLNTSDKK